MIYIIN